MVASLFPIDSWRRFHAMSTIALTGWVLTTDAKPSPRGSPNATPVALGAISLDKTLKDNGWARPSGVLRLASHNRLG